MSLALTLLLAGAAAPEPTLLAARRKGALQIDGLLDEPDWRAAPAASGFRQREPHEGAAASEPTELRVLYDGSQLYVGVLAKDSEPTRVVAHVRQRDKLLEPTGLEDSHEFAGDDAVAILLDPFRDRRNAVVFATNANGAEFDALITDESGAFNADWRTLWTVRARRVPEGWSAELAIPFRSLRYPSASGPEGWGLNAWRMLRRKNEESLWTAWSRDGGGFQRVSQAGRLAGLTGLPRSGLNLEVKPYVSGALAQARPDAAAGAFETTRDMDAGLDVKWEARPGLVLDGTLHPDFAQVEADDEQVNLTRFDLFFPEKREFFLENAGIFEFGWRSQDETPPFLLFFSRRIGIDGREQVPVRGGARLSGRLGRRTTVGFLGMSTGEGPAAQPAASFGALRVKRDVGENGYLGGMIVDRRAAGSGNSAGGIDASFWPSKTVNLEGFAAYTQTTGPGGDGGAWRLSADYSGDRFGLFAQHLAIDPETDPQVGFVTRADIRRSDALGRYTARPSALGLRRIDLYFEGQYIARTSGEKQDAGAGPTLNFEWNSGDRLAAYYFAGTTRLLEPFALEERVPVPAGEYAVRQTSLSLSSAARRPVMLTARAERADTYGGRLTTLGGTARISPGSHLSLELRFDRNRVRLPAGGFDADISSVRAVYAFTNRLFVSAFVQHNSLERRIVTNLRLNFIHRPGSDLYLVYNDERGGEAWRRVIDRSLVLKLTLLNRF